MNRTVFISILFFCIISTGFSQFFTPGTSYPVIGEPEIPVRTKTQNLLNLPESIIFDVSHNRYLVSNYGTGDIIQIDSNNNQEYFIQNGRAIQGLEIVGNVVYAGCDSLVRGFDLETGNMVMNIPVTGVSNLNDITADTTGNLYLSDVFGTKIIKVNINSQSCWVFVEGDGILRPNGIFYDKPYNRILVCSYRTNSPIQAISCADSSVTTLTSTSISNCDGITKDNNGRCYVTSWNTRSIYRFDPDFNDPPETVYQNSCGPADISYDAFHNEIAIPLQLCNDWSVMQVTPPLSGRGPGNHSGEDGFSFLRTFPNPANDKINIEFTLQQRSPVTIVITDIYGRDLAILFNEIRDPGKHQVIAGMEHMGLGIYFLSLKTYAGIIVERIMIRR